MAPKQRGFGGRMKTVKVKKEVGSTYTFLCLEPMPDSAWLSYTYRDKGTCEYARNVYLNDNKKVTDIVETKHYIEVKESIPQVLERWMFPCDGCLVVCDSEAGAIKIKASRAEYGQNCGEITKYTGEY